MRAVHKRSASGRRIIVNGAILTMLLLLSKSYAQENKNPDRDWTIVNSYQIIGKASGLAWDGTWLYCGIFSGTNKSKIYKINPQNGNYMELFSCPQIQNAYGLSSDGTNLYVISREATGPSYLLKLSMTGSIISTITLPDQSMSGVAYDEGGFWVQTFYPDPGKIFHIDSTGTVIDQIFPPGDQSWDICLQGQDLWVADYYGNTLYKITRNGAIIENHASEGDAPAGVVFDGAFLWYVDGPINQNSTLYKVNLGSSGTPQIQAPTSHYFGNVSLGSPSVWNMPVNNTGTGDLIIDSISFEDGNEALTVGEEFPITVIAGSSKNIQLSFSPDVSGPLEAIAIIHSNDPITPHWGIELTGYAIHPQAFLYAEQVSYNFENKRIHSSSRWWFEFKNTGSQPLIINNITIDNPDFYADNNTSFPISLQTLESARIGFWFHPSAYGSHEADIEINNNSNNSTFNINLTGMSTEAEYPIGELLWELEVPEMIAIEPNTFLRIEDVSGDESDDVVLCSAGNTIYCINGNASGTTDIIWEKTIGTVEYTRGISSINDINGDGFKDIIIGTAWGDKAITALSGLTGNIIWRHQTNNYGSGGWVYAVDSQFDYNGDAFPDVLAATGDDANGTGPKRVYCLNGQTGAVIWEFPNYGAVYSVIGINDFTGDGIPDVVAGATDAGETNGQIIGINGLNGSLAWSTPTSGSAVWALESLGDINNDGIGDIIAGSFNGSVYIIDATNGNPVYTTRIGNVLILDFFKLGDINNDGHIDIAVNHSGTSAIVLSGFNGNALWTTPLADKCHNVSPLNDITGDGINELAAGTLYQSNWLYYLNGFDGTIIHSFNFGEPIDALQSIPDITDDHSMDIVVGGRNGKITAYSGGIVNTPETFQIGFTIKEESELMTPVAFAKITISPVAQIIYTNQEGISFVSFPNGDYSYIVEKDGYFPESGSFTVNGENQELSVNLEIDDIYIPTVKEIPFKMTIIPNPVSHQALISIILPGASHLEINIYNASGHLISTPSKGYYEAGEHHIIWEALNKNGDNLPSGIYFVELRSENIVRRTRILLIQ